MKASELQEFCEENGFDVYILSPGERLDITSSDGGEGLTQRTFRTSSIPPDFDIDDLTTAVAIATDEYKARNNDPTLSKIHAPVAFIIVGEDDEILEAGAYIIENADGGELLIETVEDV
jgi:hypothetical protein